MEDRRYAARGGTTMTNYNERLDEAEYSNCCGANDIYDGNLGNNEGVCADCGEHCEMEAEL
jgi:hypothetical protein